MSNKSTNKEQKITVRLTPNQALMLNDMSTKLGVTKSVLIRFILDNFIKQYEQCE